MPARGYPIQRRLNIGDCCPGRQFLAPVLTRSMAGQVDGQHLISFWTDHLGKGFGFLLMAHLAMEKQISLLRRRTV